MEQVSTVKKIRKTGSSLTIYITRELNHLTLGKGDTVEVILRKPKK